jgi:uncharacterized small protein (DUF1192 family)
MVADWRYESISAPTLLALEKDVKALETQELEARIAILQTSNIN